jgi:hypothetical protein
VTPLVTGGLSGLGVLSAGAVLFSWHLWRYRSLRWSGRLRPYKFTRLCSEFLRRRGWDVTASTMGADFVARRGGYAIAVLCRSSGFGLPEPFLNDQRFVMFRFDRIELDFIIITADEVGPDDQRRIDERSLAVIHYSSLSAIEAMSRRRSEV